MIQIEAKRTFGGACFECLVSCRNDPHICVHGLVVAYALELAGFQEPQHLRLKWKRHFADFVEEKRAILRGFDASGARVHSTCERAAGMTKQLRFEQRFRDGCAVKHHKRPGAALAEGMHRPGDDFLSRSRLAFDQNGCGSWRHQANEPGQLQHDRRLADHARQRLNEAARSRRRDRIAHIPCACGFRSEILSFTQRMQQFVAPWTSRTGGRFAIDAQQVDSGVQVEEILREPTHFEVGQPVVQHQGFGLLLFNLRHGVGAANGLTDFPPHIA